MSERIPETWLADALAELRRAECDRARGSGVSAWERLTLRLRRPAIGMRVPLPIANAVRQLVAFAEPAIAGGTAALLAGLAAGTWLALVSGRGPMDAAASDDLAASDLLQAPAVGLASAYFESGDGTGFDSEPAAGPNSPVDSSSRDPGGIR